MIEKNGMLTEDSYSDFDPSKKAKYYDAEGYKVADEGNKDQLKQPTPINQSKSSQQRESNTAKRMGRQG